MRKLEYVCRWVGLAAFVRCRATIPLERWACATDMVAPGETSLRCCDYVRRCHVSFLVGTANANLMFFVTLGQAENVSGSHFVSSLEGATTPTSTADVRRMEVCAFADGTKLATGRSQFHKLRSALQQHVVG